MTSSPSHADGPREGPRTAVELQVSGIFEEVLGVPAIGRRDDFFALGGDSMAALAIAERVRARWGSDLDLEALLPDVTVAAVARALGPAAGAPVADTDPLVALQPAGARPPFFCVHPSGGSVLCYLDLARRLGFDQPFYGLRGPDPRGRAMPHRTVEAAAEAYLRAIRARHPRGPYRLGGYSFGGYVAYEMACRLAAAGEPPALLALLDTRAPTPAGQPPERGLVAELAAVLEDAELGSDAGDDGAGDGRGALPSLAAEKRLWDRLAALAERHLARVPLEDPRDESGRRAGPSRGRRRRRRGRLGAIQRFFRAYRFLPAGETEVGYRDVHRYMRFLRANFRASRDYQAGTYDRPVVLIQAADRLTEAEDDADTHHAGWARLLRGPLDRRLVPGHHLGLLVPPTVVAVATELRAALDAAADAAN